MGKGDWEDLQGLKIFSYLNAPAWSMTSRNRRARLAIVRALNLNGVCVFNSMWLVGDHATAYAGGGGWLANDYGGVPAATEKRTKNIILVFQGVVGEGR